MVAQTQTLNGINSLVEERTPIEDSIHVIFWDLENCTLDQCVKELWSVKETFHLNTIYVTGDVEQSYRAWCFSRRSFRDFLDILLHTRYLDWNFFYYTVRRYRATLRLGRKKNRRPQRIVATLREYGEHDLPLPDQFEFVTYDTGMMKRGHTINVTV